MVSSEAGQSSPISYCLEKRLPIILDHKPSKSLKLHTDQAAPFYLTLNSKYDEGVIIPDFYASLDVALQTMF